MGAGQGDSKGRLAILPAPVWLARHEAWHARCVRIGSFGCALHALFAVFDVQALPYIFVDGILSVQNLVISWMIV